MTAGGVLSAVTVADVLAVLAALAVTRPSLVPRSGASQLLAVGGAVFTAYGVGTVLQQVITMPAQDTRPRLLAVSLAWTVGGILVALVVRDHLAPRFRRPAQVLGTLGSLVALTAVLDLGLRALGWLDDAVAERWGASAAQGLRAAAVVMSALYVVQRLWRHVTDQQTLALRKDRPVTGLLTFAATVGLCVAALAGTSLVFRRTAAWVSDALGWPPHGARAAAGLGLLGLVAVVGLVAFAVLRWWFTRVDGILDGRYAHPPTSELMSGYPGAADRRASEVGFAALGRGGQRFVTTAPTAAEIAAATRAEAMDPIRIYVGSRSGGPWYRRLRVTGRAELALREIDRTRALTRRHLVVAVPTGSGTVDPAAVEAFEYLTHGDCATVVLQYAVLPSWMAMVLMRRRARSLYRELYRQLEDAVAPRGSGSRDGGTGRRPEKILLFGESLGAMISQEAYLEAGRIRSDEAPRAAGAVPSERRLGVDAALWVGTPYLSRWRSDPGVPAACVREVSAKEHLPRVGGPSRVRFLLFAHEDDPVPRFGLPLLVRPPDWAFESVRERLARVRDTLAARFRRAVDLRNRTPRNDHRDAPEEQETLRLRPWRPGVTFFQVAGDLVGAVSPRGGLRRSTAHDYGSDIPSCVSIVLGRGADVAGSVVDALEERNAVAADGPRHPPGRAPRGSPSAEITELRVHGVGGAPPENTLNYPLTFQVAGDEIAGFYRCGSPEDRPADRRLHHREAYAWGGLTSGAWFRAFWVLLLPFTLLNVSFWMGPAGAPAGDGPRTRRSRLATGAVPRLHRAVALAMTLGLVLTACGVGMYAVGWRCPSDGACVNGVGFLAKTVTIPGLGSAHLAVPTDAGWRAVVTILPGLLALAGIWALGHASRHRYERWPRRDDRAHHQGDPARALADRNFWRGGIPVSRLQYLHTTAALTVLTVVLAYPAYRALAGSPAEVVLVAVLAAAGILLLVATVLTLDDRVVGRPAAHSAEPEGSGGTAGTPLLSGDGISVALQAMALGALVLLALAALVVGRSWHPVPAAAPATHLTPLPGYGLSLGLVFLLQAVLVICLGVALLPAARYARRTRRDGPAGGRAPDGYAPFVGGFAPAVVSGLATLVGAALSTGVLLAAAQLTGSPRFGKGPGDVELPRTVGQGSVVVVTAMLAVLLSLAALHVGRLLLAGVFGGDVVAGYGRGGGIGVPPDESGQPWVAKRRAQIAKSWAAGWMVDRAFVPLTGIVAFGTVGLLLSPRTSWWPALVGPSLWLVGVLTMALLGYMYTALRDRGRRRFLGVLWDVCTFWPRAAHPFAAPCYAERAVPDLVCRIEALVKRPADEDVFPYSSRGVVLVGYSQGSILAAAAVQQLAPDAVERLALVTCASPLRRLYARCFPAYFTAETVRPGTRPAASTAPDPVLPTLASAGLWRNVYRRSDFIGSWVHRPPRPDERPDDDADSVDRLIRDPRGFGSAYGDLALPRIGAHGGYLADPALVAHVDGLARTLRHRLIATPRAVRPEVAGAARPSSTRSRRVGRAVPRQNAAPVALLAFAAAGWAGWWRESHRARSAAD